MNRFSFKNKAIKRVLLIHPYGIGDALFITPAIKTLKENGIHQIDLFLGSRTRGVFEKNPNIHRIFEWIKVRPKNFKERIHYLINLSKLYFQIWKNHYQVVIDFSPTAKFSFPALFFFWVPVRVGFSFRGRGLLLSRKINIPDGFSIKSMVEYYLDLVRLLGFEPFSERMDFFLDHSDSVQAQILLQSLKINLELPVMAMGPGGGESWGKDARLKRWPVHYFAQLIKKIFERRSIAGAILILGSKNERDLGDELIHQLDGVAVFNLCGETSIRITASLLTKSIFLIANDSGLVHLAHALEVPVVSIFGPVDPQVYGPYPQTEKAIVVTNKGPACRPCYQQFRYQRLCAEVECLNQLTPEVVYQQIEASGFLNSVKPVILK